jgi:SAM-dependent methyltransferase
MSSDKRADPRQLIEGLTSLTTIVDAVLSYWPEHSSYLARSLRPRSTKLMESSEDAASAILRLVGAGLARFAADYRWTCDRLRDEELFFHREERYRLSTFAEADEEVYSNPEYMSKYVNGLLLSQVVWFNHAATFEMFLNRVIGLLDEPADYLEIGPGHGLMTYFAGQSPFVRTLAACDVSDVSLRDTREALDKLGLDKPIALTLADITDEKEMERRFGLIVASEVLEHLERPDIAIAKLRRCIVPDGRLFINVPINSPSPDHIYLLSGPQEVTDLIEAGGFSIDRMELYATQGVDIERALEDRISISAAVLARPC